MEFKKFLRIAFLPMSLCCLFLTANAQTEKTDQTPVKKEEKKKTVSEDGKTTTIKKTDVDKHETTEKVKVKQEDANAKSVIKVEDDGDMKAKDKIEIEGAEGDSKIEQKTKVDGNETKVKTTVKSEDGDKSKIVTKTEEEDGVIQKETKVKANGETEKFKTTETASTMGTPHAYTWRESTDKWYMPKSYSYKFSNNAAGTAPSANDKGPVYAIACKDLADPSQCTENFMKAKFLNVYQPGLTFPEGYSGVEYVSFDVDATGKISGYQVVKQPVVCEPCAQAAVNHISALAQWQPGTQGGQPVATSIVVPIYFDTSLMGKNN